jgi:cell division protein FtsN
MIESPQSPESPASPEPEMHDNVQVDESVFHYNNQMDIDHPLETEESNNIAEVSTPSRIAIDDLQSVDDSVPEQELQNSVDNSDSMMIDEPSVQVTDQPETETADATEEPPKKTTRSTRSATSAETSAHTATTEDGVELFCLCRQPYDENRFYIQCDNCDEWFVKLTQGSMEIALHVPKTQLTILRNGTVHLV